MIFMNKIYDFLYFTIPAIVFLVSILFKSIDTNCIIAASISIVFSIVCFLFRRHNKIDIILSAIYKPYISYVGTKIVQLLYDATPIILVMVATILQCYIILQRLYSICIIKRIKYRNIIDNCIYIIVYLSIVICFISTLFLDVTDASVSSIILLLIMLSGIVYLDAPANTFVWYLSLHLSNITMLFGIVALVFLWMLHAYGNTFVSIIVILGISIILLVLKVIYSIYSKKINERYQS